VFKTRVTEMLGIEYPIICGGFGTVTQIELAAAVSNAGGFGIIASAYHRTPEALRDAIREVKNLTDKPFGVNISLFPSIKPLPNKEFIEVIIEERVKAVETSGTRSPEEHVSRLKEGNVLLIHKSATVRHALKGQEIGADMVAIVGMENGGATGMEDVSTLVLVPILVDAATVPVISGGGFADGRGLVAALALGAEGVVMGTRFMATKECSIHPNYKDWLLKATERDTVLVMRSIQNTHRALRSKVTEELLKLEAKGASFEDMSHILGGDSSRKVSLDGSLDTGLAFAGEAVGLIQDIPTVKELIDRIVKEAKVITQRLHNISS
jgi:NAD(P)H-dependent flavin oxidoreductase YrpB (nitropropane dioxygenase family)